MTLLLGSEFRRYKTVYIAAGVGFLLWFAMVGVLALAPLNDGETRPGVFALTDTFTHFYNEDGELQFGPTQLRR